MPLIAAVVQARCVKADMISWAGLEMRSWWSRMFLALICDTCGEVEYTLERSREIDAIMEDFFAGRLLAKPQAAEEIAFKT